MKKLLILLLASALILAGCSADKQTTDAQETVTSKPEETNIPAQREPIELSVMIPFGSPALSLAQFLINENSQSESFSMGENATYKTEMVNGADPLVVAFTSQSHDVIIAPTNLGAKFYSTGIPYIYCGAVVYGNLYLASMEPLNSLADLENMEIVAFSQNSTPDVVLLTILNESGMADKVTIRYVGSVSEAQGELLAGTAQAALLAEPILSVTKTKADISIIDLQDEWAQLTGMQSYPQAGIYIKSDLIQSNPEVVEMFLSLIKLSISQTNADPAATAASLEAIEFGLPAKIIESAIPYSHLVFESAADSRDSLEFYYGKIMDLNPALVGGSLPDDEFYY